MRGLAQHSGLSSLLLQVLIPHTGGSGSCQLPLLHRVLKWREAVILYCQPHGVKVPQLGSVKQEQSHTQSVSPEGSGHGQLRDFSECTQKLFCLFLSSCLLTWP